MIKSILEDLEDENGITGSTDNVRGGDDRIVHLLESGENTGSRTAKRSEPRNKRQLNVNGGVWTLSYLTSVSLLKVGENLRNTSEHSRQSTHHGKNV